MKFLNFFRRLFQPRVRLNFNPKAQTIPQAFGFPLKDYDLLVNELTNFIELNERLVALENYLKSTMFEKYKMDLTNPNHAALLGYAFASAVLIQRDIQQKVAVNKLLQTFYPEQATNIPKDTAN